MKTLQNQLDDLDAALKIVGHEMEKLHEKEYQLYEGRHVLVSRIILEEDLLKDSVWVLELNPNGLNYKSYLTYHGTLTDKIERVRDLARANWHSDFELQPGLQLRFNDELINLYFSNLQDIVPLVQKYGLQLQVDGILHLLSRSKKETEDMQKICDLIGIGNVQ